MVLICGKSDIACIIVSFAITDQAFFQLHLYSDCCLLIGYFAFQYNNFPLSLHSNRMEIGCFYKILDMAKTSDTKICLKITLFSNS
jgi:hypothetical protein